MTCGDHLRKANHQSTSFKEVRGQEAVVGIFLTKLLADLGTDKHPPVNQSLMSTTKKVTNWLFEEEDWAFVPQQSLICQDVFSKISTWAPTWF